MLVAISVLRESGVLNYVLKGLTLVLHTDGVNTDFVSALPTALMKPVSGSGARAMMIEAMQTYGVDSFAGRLACVFQGSADTTFPHRRALLRLRGHQQDSLRHRIRIDCGILRRGCRGVRGLPVLRLSNPRVVARCHAHMPAESAREGAVVGKSTRLRDARDRLAGLDHRQRARSMRRESSHWRGVSSNSLCVCRSN